MGWLVAGLVLFLGVHLARALAPGVRDGLIMQWGENGWKMRYSVASVIGLVLIIWGYGQARSSGVFLWMPPVGFKHANSLFTLIAMILLAAAYVPRNHIKASIGHPMAAAVKVWAFGHLLAVGSLSGVILFGSFVLWAVLVFTAARRRDRAAEVVFPAGQWLNTLITVAVGVVFWAVFAFWAHGALIGIRLFG
jgi:uncharacterized membrane protein